MHRRRRDIRKSEKKGASACGALLTNSVIEKKRERQVVALARCMQKKRDPSGRRRVIEKKKALGAHIWADMSDDEGPGRRRESGEGKGKHGPRKKRKEKKRANTQIDAVRATNKNCKHNHQRPIKGRVGMLPYDDFAGTTLQEGSVAIKLLIQSKREGMVRNSIETISPVLAANTRVGGNKPGTKEGIVSRCTPRVLRHLKKRATLPILSNYYREREGETRPL